MTTDRYTLLSHLAQFFLEREMFQTKVVEKLKVRILCSLNNTGQQNLTFF